MDQKIKYRAWDKQEKQMVYGIEETYDGLPYSELNEKVELDIYDHMSCFSSWLCGDYEVMQYTGLEDKNGNDIYEGDYLSVIIFEDNQEYKGSVVSAESGFCLEIAMLDNKYKIPFVSFGKDVISEVIGSIYENPELLEENK